MKRIFLFLCAFSLSGEAWPGQMRSVPFAATVPGINLNLSGSVDLQQGPKGSPLEIPSLGLEGLDLEFQRPGLAFGISARRPRRPAALAANRFKPKNETPSGLFYQGRHLFDGGRRLQPLGRGDVGAVYSDPAANGAAVKIINRSPQATMELLFIDDEQLLELEVKTAEALARVGAGPKVMGTFKIPGIPTPWHTFTVGLLRKRAQVEERYAMRREEIRGVTVKELIDKRKFTWREFDLIEEMLDRMADGGVNVGDMRPANIMIGSTADDLETRAYVIDGGRVLPVDPEITRDELRQTLAVQPVAVDVIRNEHGLSEQIFENFDRILIKGLWRSKVDGFWSWLGSVVLYRPEHLAPPRPETP